MWEVEFTFGMGSLCWEESFQVDGGNEQTSLYPPSMGKTAFAIGRIPHFPLKLLTLVD